METRDAINRFLLSRKAKSLSMRTITWYRQLLERFESSCPDLPLEPEPIEKFLAELDCGDERRHGYYRAVKAMYRFLRRRKAIPENPFELVEIPTRARKVPHFLMPDDLHKLLAYPHDPAIKALLLLLVDTGCRIGEATSLTIEHLSEYDNFHTATITGKTGARIVPITYETYHALMVTLPFNYKVDWLTRRVSTAFKDAGIKGTAHTLRHTFATLWAGDELILQAIMGHSSLKTTQIYRHLRTQVLCQQHAMYTPLKLATGQLRMI